jgi:hypothetical protein
MGWMSEELWFIFRYRQKICHNFHVSKLALGPTQLSVPVTYTYCKCYVFLLMKALILSYFVQCFSSAVTGKSDLNKMFLRFTVDIPWEMLKL